MSAAEKYSVDTTTIVMTKITRRYCEAAMSSAVAAVVFTAGAALKHTSGSFSILAPLSNISAERRMRIEQKWKIW